MKRILLNYSVILMCLVLGLFSCNKDDLAITYPKEGMFGENILAMNR